MEETGALVARGRRCDRLRGPGAAPAGHGRGVRVLPLLGDFQHAEDAAQEAFVHAYLDLDRLQEPAAFPGWLRRIVFTRCNRMTRRRRPETAPLDESGVAAPGPLPDELAERRQDADRVTDALARLPGPQRQALTLFYVSEFSHKELAAFLEVPVSTVKFRLHASRKRLKEELLTMTRESIRRHRPSRTGAFTDRTVQTIVALNEYQLGRLLVSTDQRELVALMQAAEELRAKVLQHVDPSLRAVLETELARHDSVPSERREALERAAGKAARIAPTPPTPSPEFVAMKKQLQKELESQSLFDMGPAAMPALFQRLAECARTEGILSLEAVREARDCFFAGGLDLVLHGTEPELIAQVLAPWRDSLVQDVATRCALSALAAREIAAKHHPMLVAFELMTLCPASTPVPAVDEKQATVARFRSVVRKQSLATMPLAELAEALLVLVWMAYKGGVERLAKALDAIDEPFARQVFGWLVEGVDGKQFDAAVVVPLFETRRQAVIRRHKLCYAMVADGLVCLQMGMNPGLLEARLRSYLD